MTAKIYSINFDQQKSILVDGVAVQFSNGSSTVTWLYGMTYRVGRTHPNSLEDLTKYSYTGTSKLFQEGEYAAINNGNGLYALVQIIDSSSMTNGDDFYGVKFSIEIVDKSPIYLITSNASAVNEGNIAYFNISSTNAPAGTNINYTITGVSSSDINGGSPYGTATIDLNGNASIAIPITADSITEGVETLTVTFEETTASIQINDTSILPIPILKNSSHKLSVIVDKGIFGPDPVILKDLTEYIEYNSGSLKIHTITYGSQTHDYNSIDKIIMTVTRDNKFTDEFKNEINNLIGSNSSIDYTTLTSLVGPMNIDNAIKYIAGADGNYVENNFAYITITGTPEAAHQLT